LSGRIDYSPAQLSLSDFIFKQKQGGQVVLNLKTDLNESGGTTAKADLRSFRITQSLAQSAKQYMLKVQPVLAGKVFDNFDGEVDGKIDLTGLPSAARLFAKENAENDPNRLLKRIDGKLDLSIKNFNQKGSFRTAAFQFAVKDDLLDFNRILVELS